MKKWFLIFLTLLCVQMHAQKQSKNLHIKTFTVVNNSVQIDTVSINSINFKVFNEHNSTIDTSAYTINFSKALLTFKKNINIPQKVIIQYTSYPDFLTKSYFTFDKKLIVPEANTETQLYSLTTNKKKTNFNPFDGLKADGSITRGVTIGNNQNAVVNSSLDLQIAGQLSDKVTLRASLIDTNLPIQENGNTYELNEFDRIFIELNSDNWNINAGDIYLNNNETEFLNFNKKVAGIGVKAKIDNDNSEIHIGASGAFVNGKYNKVQFKALEGNQGPYQISDFGNETYVLILSGTEQIYVNGQLLKRGEDHDYIIDYNTAEITFNTTFPITGNMRITAEYQYNDRVYNRFITYENVNYTSEKLNISGYFYNENDLKNQSLEPSLTDEQKFILASAGDDKQAMVSPSAYEVPFDENKILYKKTLLGTTEIFEHSTNENDELYQVTFTFIGQGSGSYSLKEVIATGKIYEYVGANLGNYEPVVQLTAPEKLQLAVLKVNYNPSYKTSINAETSFSNNDLNLFSNNNDSNNTGLATKFNWLQYIVKKKWSLVGNFNYDYINENFKTIQRIQSIEFDRDWNIERTTGNQQLISTGFTLNKDKESGFNYTFSNLDYGSYYNGNKHIFNGFFNKNNFNLFFNSSLLNNKSTLEEGSFLRYHVNATYDANKTWFGVATNAETNKQETISTKTLTPLSQKFNEFEAFFGVGDSTKVFAQFGANFRITDSVQNNKLEQVNNAKTFYVRSSLVQTNNANVSVYVNYRNVKNENFKDESSLNSKISYKQQLWKQLVSWNIMYQTRSGSLPLQDYTYIETEPQQGFYMWIDYNNNGIKELNEFEIAQFGDEAKYLRVILPTVNYIATHQNIFNQSLILNPQQWQSKKGFQKFLSHFYNQTSLLVDSKLKKTDNGFNLNPFDINNTDLLGLTYNLNNSFYFNKGQRHYSTTYRYLKNKLKSTTTIDGLENVISQHQLLFEHEIADFWRINLNAFKTDNRSNSENFSNRNYKLVNYNINPKLSYFYNNDAYFSVFYNYKSKENTIGDLESLKTSNFGFAANYAHNKKSLFKAEFNLFNNSFDGNSSSPVGFQMLEGLQPGKNYTWSLIFQQKLFSFLNLNLNYLGRKSETSNTIHTGSVELRAYF